MAFQIPQNRRSLLPPRAVVYLILLLSVAWVLWRYDKNVQQEQAPRQQKTTTPAMAGGSETEAIRSADSTVRGPMLVLLGESGDALGEVGKLAKEMLKDRGIDVVKMAGDAPEDLEILKASFSIPKEQTEFPVAILFSAADQELARILPPITREKLQALPLFQK